MSVRRVKSPGGLLRGRGERRGLSGLGLLLVIVGLVALAVTYSVLPPSVYKLWPTVLIALGVFGLLRRPGWVQELDYSVPELGRAADRPRRLFSWVLVGAGFVFLLFTFGLVDQRIVGPVVLISLGLLLLWRRSR